MGPVLGLVLTSFFVVLPKHITNSLLLCICDGSGSSRHGTYVVTTVAIVVAHSLMTAPSARTKRPFWRPSLSLLLLLLEGAVCSLCACSALELMVLPLAAPCGVLTMGPTARGVVGSCGSLWDACIVHGCNSRG